jgi:hypothetical protein
MSCPYGKMGGRKALPYIGMGRINNICIGKGGILGGMFNYSGFLGKRHPYGVLVPKSQFD